MIEVGTLARDIVEDPRAVYTKLLEELSDHSFPVATEFEFFHLPPSWKSRELPTTAETWLNRVRTPLISYSRRSVACM